MTDYELLSLYTEYATLFVTMVTVYISMLFAYLIANYIAADKLSLLQFSIVTALFVGFALDAAIGVRIHIETAASLQAEIDERVEAPGSDIAFLGSQGIADWLPSAVFVFYLTTVIIAVVFAVQVRRSRNAPSVDESQ